LILPFAFIRTTNNVLGDTTTTTSYGFFYWRSNLDLGAIEISDSDSFELDWLSSDGVYSSHYFGDLWFLGVIMVISLLVGLALSITETKTNNSTYILLASGILLLIMRYFQISDNNTFFYDKEEFAGFSQTYIEIPVGCIIGLIFAALEFKKGKNEV
jgi:hypothetical protein